jgi:hypothetical protein
MANSNYRRQRAYIIPAILAGIITAFSVALHMGVVNAPLCNSGRDASPLPPQSSVYGMISCRRTGQHLKCLPARLPLLMQIAAH